MERRIFEESFKQAFEGAEMNPSDKVWAGIERELQKSEGSFKQAFEGAGISPSDNVWMGIELELEKAEGYKTRRRLLFYKMLAAASVAFALFAAGMGYYVVNSKTASFNEQLAALKADKTRTNTESVTNNNAPSSSNAPSEIASNDQSKRERRATNAESGLPDGKSNNNNEFNGEQVVNATVPSTTEVISLDNRQDDNSAIAFENSASSVNSLDKYSNRSLPAFYSPMQPVLTLPKKEEVDPGQKLLLEQRVREQMLAVEDKKEKENTSEKVWTSLGFAAGGFSSVNTGVTPSASSNMVALTNSTVPDKQAKASGISYSVGLNVGTRLSKRWTIQGGVNYLTQSSDYTATNVVAGANFETLKAESINELDKIPQLADAYASSKLTPTVPYSVNNNVKFFSVPVQAGYLLVNKKFGLQLNAGVSTDLFLENTITPEGGGLNATTQGRGEDSPYRSVNFSGLMGTEFSYRFGSHYRVALNPGLRYPLNSVYKSDVGIQSTPLTFDVGLRFKYIFH